MIELGINHSTTMVPIPWVKTRPSRAKAETMSVGRPTVMTPTVIGKLEQAFAIDATVEEACFFAGIHRDTFYAWRKENPELSDMMETLRQKPILAMRQAAVKLGMSSYSSAMDYLSRKKADEFGNKSKLEHSGKIESIGPQTAATQKIAEEYEAKMKAAITEEAKKGKP